jgi:hypothetical protein
MLIALSMHGVWGSSFYLLELGVDYNLYSVESNQGRGKGERGSLYIRKGKGDGYIADGMR